jgi:putative ubiquitin-RnfH superfamily antitoxin RatB of RatAB toxin-antitoxin module
MQVTVAYSPAARQVRERVVQLPEGATVRAAIEASGWREAGAGTALTGDDVGLWGRRCGLDHVLREGDRVELYRGLLVDPKVARRERFRKQGARTAGLFAQRRPGAKPGY